MYYAVSKLDADRFANLDFVMNFGISAEIKVLFTNFIKNGGSFDEVVAGVFRETDKMMLLKLHNYFNWADKKLHTAFFIDNKDQINEDLLADFKGGASINVNPGLASTKPKKVEETKQKGIQARDLTFKDNVDILRTGQYKRDAVDVTSHMDFPSLGAMDSANQSQRGQKKQ